MIEPNSQMIFVNSDTEIELQNLTNDYTGTAVNNATVTGVLSDSTGATVDRFMFAFVPGSTGNYLGTIPQAIGATLIVGDTYTLDVEATDGVMNWGQRQEYLCGYRSGN